MRNFKVNNLCINGNIASGTEAQAIRAIRESAAWNN